eukprot:scaffold2045_cov404-Prasinococcus_capsulatus_cf.AAC.15
MTRLVNTGPSAPQQLHGQPLPALVACKTIDSDSSRPRHRASTMACAASVLLQPERSGRRRLPGTNEWLPFSCLGLPLPDGAPPLGRVMWRWLAGRGSRGDGWHPGARLGPTPASD